MPKKKHAHKKAGKPPGFLVYTGDYTKLDTSFNIIEFNQNEIQEYHYTDLKELGNFNFSRNLNWLNVSGLSKVEKIAKIGELFKINPLTLEDIVNVGSRPNYEEFEDYVAINLRMLYYKEDKLISEHVSFVLTQNTVISFQELEADVFDAIRLRLREGKGRIRTAGTDYLLYALIDAVVDHYFIVFENFGDKIETLEDEILSDPDDRDSIEIQALKREVYRIRKAVFPLREAISRFERSEHKLVKDITKPFIRDVHAHSIQIIETVENYRDATMSLMDLYMSSISNKMNNVMKVLTIMSSIFIPLTFLAGIYGMNFNNIPELRYENGYFVLLAVMFVIFIIMLYYFKRKKWF